MVAFRLLLAASLFALAAFLVYYYLSGLIWGSGYAPTPRKKLEAAAELLGLAEGDVVYDLGSGFGRAVAFFARRYRVSAVGVEIDPLRRRLTNYFLRRDGLAGEVRIVGGNLLDLDLAEAKKVFVFLTPLIMRRLQEKAAREMPRDGRVVSVEHKFPDWTPARSVENVHLYIVGEASANRREEGRDDTLGDGNL